jgi:hypothetical protein
MVAKRLVSGFVLGEAAGALRGVHTVSVLIRDTTQHGRGPVLRVSAETWRARH